MSMRFFINENHDPAFNLALEEVLCTNFPEPFLMLWRNAPAVIIGKNQNTFAEVNAAFAGEHNIPVVRRTTGGGAVYHDLGNVNYSLLVHERLPGADSFAVFAEPVIACLRRMGVDAGFSGRNDILVDGRKISGSAQRSFEKRTLFHGTLLFDADMEMLSRVLTPRKSKLESKGVKSVRGRVANLKEFLPGMSVETFLQELAKHLQHFASPPEAVPAEWCAAAEKLAAERYRQWAWNWGTPFDSSWENSARFPGAGVVELKVKLLNGRIEDLMITGDFFGDSSAVTQALKGILFRRSEAAAKLKNIDVSEYIRGLSNQEFLSLFEIL